MTQVSMKNSFPVSPEKLWEAIGGFNALPDWHPAVQRSELEEGGSIRRLSLLGGGEIVEKLEKMDDDGHTYSYSILKSPLPVANYTAVLTVRDDGKGGSEVTWSSDFEPAGQPEADASRVIEDIYKAGFENLKKMFGA